MANAKIFCNTPWYEAHIYWDGSLGICCQESRKLSTTHNIKTTSLVDWFNSAPVIEFRKSLLSNTPTDICSSCYHEERAGGTSRRHRSNQKSAIFTKIAFENSFDQSPSRRHFTDNGYTDTLPIDLHIDLGNYCNLACKMCWSGASSTIAVQNVRWGITSDRQYLGNDWTKDPVIWHRFLNELLNIPKIKNIHFMGGETLLTSKFEEFVDFMIQHKKFDLCFSFVTNGTVFNQRLVDKLKLFARVGIEVSIETVTKHNNYIRQGTETDVVLLNIQKYQSNCNNSNITVTIRPAISVLSIGYYHTLLNYCLENQLLIKSLLVTNPKYLNVNVLPMSIRESYMNSYLNILSLLDTVNIDNDYNESDQNNYKNSIKMQAIRALNLLKQDANIDQLPNMVKHCKNWDQVYNLNALDFYPELTEIFVQNGY